MVEYFTGATKLYGHKDTPDALRRIADKIPKKEGNPHQPVYGIEVLEKVIREIEEEFEISIPVVHIKTKY